jgi:hypothetical protein
MRAWSLSRSVSSDRRRPRFQLEPVRFSDNGVLADAEAAAYFGGRMTLRPKHPEPSDGLVVPVEICVCALHHSLLWWKVMRKSLRPSRCAERPRRRLVLVQLGPDPSPKAPAGKVQALGRTSTGSSQACSSARRPRSGIHEGLAESAPIRHGADAVPALEAVAEAVLISVRYARTGLVRGGACLPIDPDYRDAGYAAQRAAQPIFRSRNDSMATSIFHTSDSRSACTGRQ